MARASPVSAGKPAPTGDRINFTIFGSFLRNIAQNAIIAPTQTFNFAKSYIDATSMYGRSTFLAPTILLPVALGTAPA
jgi:hypothetical protein